MGVKHPFLDYWLNRRFIFAVEVLGFTVTALVAAGAVYSLVKQVDVFVHVKGELSPRTDTVKADADWLVFRWEVVTGTEVSAGDILCEVVTAPEAQQQVRIREHLDKLLLDAQSTNGGDVLGTAIVHLEAAASALEVPVDTKTVRASATGAVRRLVEREREEVVPESTIVAVLYDLSSLELEGLCEGPDRRRVGAGQPAEVMLEGVHEPAHGEVISIRQDGPVLTVQLGFAHVPPEVQNALLAVVKEPTARFPEVQAKVMVGQRSLFATLFRRGM